MTRDENTKCVICGSDHQVQDCEKFKRISLKEKADAVIKHGLCRGCLTSGHIRRSCRKRMKCEKCDRWHPTVLHDDSLVTSRSVAAPSEKSHLQEET